MKQSNEKILNISVYETILVSEWYVVGVIIQRITTWNPKSKTGEALVSISEYRKLLEDKTSTDQQIISRLKYLEAFCKNIIRPELQIYDKQSKN